MLLTLVDVVACENPRCREFAKIVPDGHGARSYYCQVCAKVSRPRTIDAALAAAPERYEQYLRQKVRSRSTAPRS